jgi:hypothetical protein
MTSSETVANADIFLWALFELGGSDKFDDVEAVFLKAFELAPQRLSLRTNTQIPDLKVRKEFAGGGGAKAKIASEEWRISSDAFRRRTAMDRR